MEIQQVRARADPAGRAEEEGPWGGGEAEARGAERCHSLGPPTEEHRLPRRHKH